MTDAPKRIWAFHAPDIEQDNPACTIVAGEKAMPFSAEYHRADLSTDLVRAALYKTRGYTWSGVEALIADPAAVAAIVAQVMETEHD